jgi:hypothetical protein
MKSFLEAKTTRMEVFNNILIQHGAVRLFALFGGLNIAMGLILTLNGQLKMALIGLGVGIVATGIAFYGQHLRTTTPLRYFRPVSANLAAMLKR